MSDENRPLPIPPKTPFGRKRQDEETPQEPLMADQLAMAAATGSLEEYMKKNLPDNEHAQRLAMMMMGMTGMMQGMPQPNAAPDAAAPSGTAHENESGSGVQVPEDLQQAVMSGDLEKLKGLLIREHQKRSGEKMIRPAEEGLSESAPQSGIEKEVLDQLISIASDNSVSLDWLIMRSLRVYIQEYRRTGRL